MTKRDACHVCGAWPAGCWLGWPGFTASQPEKIRGKRIRLCRFGGDCHAQGILRAERFSGTPWPWMEGSGEIRAKVEALRPPTDPPPADPPRPAAPPPQPTLI